MKNDFFTIPDAPNYEINSELVVRNKKTGRILKESFKKGGRVHLAVEGKSKHLRVNALRCKAVDAMQGDSWLPVPSLEYRYEVNMKGELRNIRTRHHLTLNRDGKYSTEIKGKKKSPSKTSLLWEVFGIIPKNYRSNKPVAVIAESNGEQVKFKSITEAAEFLSKIIFRPASTLSTYFGKRIAEIDGWKITYYPPKDLTDVTDTVGDWVKCKKPKNGTWLKTGGITQV